MSVSLGRSTTRRRQRRMSYLSLTYCWIQMKNMHVCTFEAKLHVSIHMQVNKFFANYIKCKLCIHLFFLIERIIIFLEIIFFNNNKTSVFLKKRGESVQMIAVARFVEPILQWYSIIMY